MLSGEITCKNSVNVIKKGKHDVVLFPDEQKLHNFKNYSLSQCYKMIRILQIR